jgi:uncharacterized membrane protein
MRTLGLLVVLALVACEGDDAEEDATDDGECADAPRYEDVEIFATCTMCHASTLVGADRNGALATVNFDTYDDATMSAARGLERVEAGAMPPPASGLSVTQVETDELERWLVCGMPE